MPGRMLALVICLAAVVGIALELFAQVNQGASLVAATWGVLRFFTIITNALLAVVFGWIAISGDRFRHPRLLAGLVMAIALVGVIVALLLQGARELAGATLISDFLLHQLTPVLGVVYWLVFARKGCLTFRDPLLWAIYPTAYLGYALARGAADGRYPYPFIDVPMLGATQVAINAIAIAAAFVVAGGAMVTLDRALVKH
jgi:hypothetical protein